MKISRPFTNGRHQILFINGFWVAKNDWIREAVNDWDNHFLKT